MSIIDPDTRQRLDTYLADAGLGAGARHIEALTPDASDRRYFRVTLERAPPVVLAVHAGPIVFEAMPFADVSDLLARMRLPAPAVLGHSNALGIIALQDLGDVTLQAALNGAPVTALLPRYEEAVALIAELQRKGRAFASTSHVTYRLAFDVEKLRFELDFFAEHFLAGHRGVRLTPDERAALSREWSAIVEELAEEPRVVCHRDYHSRNLMLHDGRLHLIDFQDARMGPDTYDLASLLRDSYVDVTEAEVEQLLAHFRSLAGIGDAAEFRRRFDLMAVQRNIKALGTFGFQASTRGNPAFLQYMPRTLASVRANLVRYPRFDGLRRVLGAHVEELR